jgi:biopolymer transport protein ExbD
MASPGLEPEEPLTQINVVPMVDIMLVLLVIFMITASFISNPSLNVETPKALTHDPAAPSSVSLVLTAQGEVFFQNRRLAGEDLIQALRAQAVRDPDTRLVLSADASIPHGKVVELLDLARQAGITKAALGVTPR